MVEEIDLLDVPSLHVDVAQGDLVHRLAGGALHQPRRGGRRLLLPRHRDHIEDAQVERCQVSTSTNVRLSQNIAGVTIMALGNGAPDIFSALAGIGQGRPELVAISSSSLQLYSASFDITFIDNLVFLFLMVIRNTSSPFHDIKPKVFGSLFGAGVFVTTCVAGAVSIAQPFKLMERPFLRRPQYSFGGQNYFIKEYYKQNIVQYFEVLLF